ncbi:hypothetical protein V5N11_026429 [Cardamine amara subsp. amara]|uniref:PGG domain-containing protein n=1 Tax=Cardamine amara subsp. amara TaxID=228776 RepID=A0ABD1B2H1_CARAN
MDRIKQACMLVATLIATVVFAAAFPVPGGYDDTMGKDEVTDHYKKAGFPQFRKTLLFDMFILSDMVSLLSSVTAIMLFFSILTSRYRENDFMKDLPRKLMFGLLALFVSIVSMVLVFTLAIILICYQEPIWSLIVIIFLASLTALLFPILHLHLWFDSVDSTYSILSKFLFHRRKNSIFR